MGDPQHSGTLVLAGDRTIASEPQLLQRIRLPAPLAGLVLGIPFPF
jgi:hypothetical protein